MYKLLLPDASTANICYSSIWRDYAVAYVWVFCKFTLCTYACSRSETHIVGPLLSHYYANSLPTLLFWVRAVSLEFHIVITKSPQKQSIYNIGRQTVYYPLFRRLPRYIHSPPYFCGRVRVRCTAAGQHNFVYKATAATKQITAVMDFNIVD